MCFLPTIYLSETLWMCKHLKAPHSHRCTNKWLGRGRLKSAVRYSMAKWNSAGNIHVRTHESYTWISIHIRTLLFDKPHQNAGKWLGSFLDKNRLWRIERGKIRNESKEKEKVFKGGMYQRERAGEYPSDRKNWREMGDCFSLSDIALGC